MSQIKFNTPLHVNLVFSKQHKRFLLLTHIVAGLSLLTIGLHIGVRLLLISYVIFSFVKLVKKTRCNYCGELHYLDENNWLWINQTNNKLQFQHGFILLPQLLLLNFIDAKSRKHS